MKLLRVLDYEHTFGSARLIGTEFLVNLRYLVINELPTSIGSLVNLEYLRVDNDKYVHISLLLKMKKLRYLEVTRLSLSKNDGDSSETNNLEVVSRIVIEYLKDEETLKCSPHLRKLKCECDPLFFLENECDPLCIQKKGVYGYRYPDLRFLTKLESLNMTALHGGKIMEINFPSNIKKLTLTGFRLPWEKMSNIGRLPNLEVLKLGSNAFVGRIWETKDGEFQQLRLLNLKFIDLKKWNVASSEHFPKLQCLIVYNCNNLQEIPSEIGEIATLEWIEVESCSKSARESARRIEQDQREMGNEELKVYVS